MSTELATIPAIARMLAACANAPQAKRIKDMAKAAEVFADRQGAADSARYAHTIGIDATALMGDFLARMEKATGGDAQRTRYQKGTESPATLKDIGIDKKESAEAQQLAEVKTKHPDVFKAIRHGEQTLAAFQREERLKDKKAEYEASRAKAIRGQIVKADALAWLPKQDECDLLLTDPPYSTDVDDFPTFAAAWLPMALAKLKPTGRAYIFIGAYPIELQTYLNIRLPDQVLVWTYQNTIGPSATDRYNLNWQAILYYCGEDAPPLLCPELNERWAVQAVNAPDGRLGNRIHQWQKPEEIARRFVMHATKPGDIVLDPFAGSGTFIHVAAELGRRAMGCDIEI